MYLIEAVFATIGHINQLQHLGLKTLQVWMSGKRDKSDNTVNFITNDADDTWQENRNYKNQTSGN